MFFFFLLSTENTIPQLAPSWRLCSGLEPEAGHYVSVLYYQSTLNPVQCQLHNFFPFLDFLISSDGDDEKASSVDSPHWPEGLGAPLAVVG